MKYIRVFIQGKPTGKGRPRFVRATGRAYTPSATASYEKSVKAQAMQAMQQSGMPEPMQCPVAVCIVARFARPASHYGTGRNAAKLKPNAPAYPSIKPDADNIGKAIGDAGNGVLWRDDAQIVEMTLLKEYCEPNEQEGVLIELWELPLSERSEYGDT